MVNKGKEEVDDDVKEVQLEKKSSVTKKRAAKNIYSNNLFSLGDTERDKKQKSSATTLSIESRQLRPLSNYQLLKEQVANKNFVEFKDAFSLLTERTQTSMRLIKKK